MAQNRQSRLGMEAALLSRDQVGVQDFVLLEDFTNIEAFIENLRKRFYENLIYTYIGPVLVSVNPYKELDIYRKEIIESYRNVNFYELPPHIFAIGDVAYRAIRSEFRDQCILISGESGAGKTEATKKVLEYVAASSTHTSDVTKVKDRLLQSNPILEAFGNAKTNRNDNSSRFGKYMDIQFDFAGAPVGGVILNYLLEKSRVCHQSEGERNFHIFYQLLRGVDDQLRAQLHLPNSPAYYFYLNQTEASKEDNRQDSAAFAQVVQALRVCDFSPDEQLALFMVVAAVLHLGNVDITEDVIGTVVFQDMGPIHMVCLLLGCTQEDLSFALLNRSIYAEDKKVSTPLNLSNAMYAKDALAKGIYSRLFTWIVQKINKSLASESKHKKAVLGLLDIYGFEIFEQNSFEQMCINYCNERLQQLFIQLTLKSEQEEYLSEGIEWEKVEYFNNKIICDLVEAKPMGLIALMDEECLRPGDTSDESLLEKLATNLGHHPHLNTHSTGDETKRKKIARDQFQLVHYAGDVTYGIAGFIEKNNDLLYRDLKEVMSRTRNIITSQCFPASEIESKKRPETSGTQFKNSMTQLAEILQQKQPSYVRCIKPNDNKQSAIFTDEIVEHQVKYLGLMENLRVRRAGFAYRREYPQFLKRYKPLCPKTWPQYHGDPKEGVREICEQLKYEPDEFKLGRTKIFIRFPRLLFATEDALQARKHELATLLQAQYKGYHERTVYQEKRKAVTTIAKYWRREEAKRLLAKRKKAAATVRSFIKGFMTRKDPPGEENKFFIDLQRQKYLLMLKDALPKNVLDKSWPPAPELLKETSEILRPLVMKNMVRKYCINCSEEQQCQFEQKIAAEGLFKGRKSSYQASIADPFIDTRLDASQEALLNNTFKTKVKPANEEIKYAAQVTKFDRNGYHQRPRVIVLTDISMYVLDDKNLKLKDTLIYNNIKAVSTSALSDGLLVLHVKTEANEKDNKGDLILQSDHIIELLTKFVMNAHLAGLLNISNDSISHSLKNGKEGLIEFTAGDQITIGKAKNGHLSVVAPNTL